MQPIYIENITTSINENYIDKCDSLITEVW